MCGMLHEGIRDSLHKKNLMEEKPLTLDDLKPFLSAWYWELKKAKEEKEGKSDRLPVKS